MSSSREGDDEDGAFSPNSRLKFLCSYGGKILPRPFDGQLKYVGGETRVLSVPRSITFKELKDKISIMSSNPEIITKYQVFPDDLDTLVSVRTDEDLRYMLEEYDRMPRSPSSSPLFRIFLFPSPTTRTTTPSSSPSMGSTTPQSNMENPSPVRLGMHRVRSTPNLGGGSLCTNNGSPIVVGGLNISNPHPQQSRVGVSYRYETCGCGRVFARGGQMCDQNRQRRCYYPPAYSGGGGRSARGRTEEFHTPPHSAGNSVNVGVMSPRARMKCIWE